MGIGKKISQKLYKANRTSLKLAKMLTDAEDLAKGRPDKVVKRNVRRKTKKEINKSINKFFKKIGL